jgi:membrane protein YdbS with pleckstrin-like domain
LNNWDLLARRSWQRLRECGLELDNWSEGDALRNTDVHEAVWRARIHNMDEGSADSIANPAERHLDPRWISVQRIRAAILSIGLAIASFIGVMAVWAGSGILVLGLLLLPLWVAVIAALSWQLQRWPGIAYRFASYRIDEGGLEIRRGVYWRTITNVPRSRVQHTDVSQGPLERRYGLGTLVVHTAGTMHSQVNLAGLDFDVARRIRTHLLPNDQSDAV